MLLTIYLFSAFIEKLLNLDEAGKYFIVTCGEENTLAYNRVGLTGKKSVFAAYRDDDLTNFLMKKQNIFNIETLKNSTSTLPVGTLNKNLTDSLFTLENKLLKSIPSRNKFSLQKIIISITIFL